MQWRVDGVRFKRAESGVIDECMKKANRQDKYIELASDDETWAETKARRKKIRQSLESEVDSKQLLLKNSS